MPSGSRTERLIQLDQEFAWHPFTQMKDWTRSKPVIIDSGKGAVLRDTAGRAYLDANASIWTNLHGHRNPVMDRAVARQLGRIAHSSMLGLANVPATLLASELIAAGNPRSLPRSQPRLKKVFFSDDGSTAMEAALKMTYEFSRRRGNPRPRFLTLTGAYHGDTVGAVSLGHIDLFHKAYAGLLFETDSVMSPYCYRCPFNRAKPDRADARLYRRCRWECLDKVEQKLERADRQQRPYSAMVVEPLIQGAAGMIPQPEGWLSAVASRVRSRGALLIADEVMTGFARTGGPGLFACHQEKVQPDLLVLAKGLTGGYLPMAATVTTSPVFNAFLGEYEEFKTFFHGHSYTGNQLASAAGLASLGLLNEARSVEKRSLLEENLEKILAPLWKIPTVGDIRRVGLVAGVELVRDWRTRQPFALKERAGIKVCEEMARRGVLTRPIGNVLVIMPPYCTTSAQMEKIGSVLRRSIETVLC